MKDKYCLLTNDVETTSIWHNSLRDETGFKVLKEGMPMLLDTFEKYNILSTFFFTGYIAKLYPEIVKMVIPFGHEVASHGLSHKKEHGFDIMSFDQQLNHLIVSKKILEDISGQEVISFRSPALRVNSDTAIALAEAGYKIDSSIASQRFDFFMSIGGSNKLKWLTAPRLPYLTKTDDLFKKGDGIIREIPISATILPYVGTTMRIFPYFTMLQRKLLNIETTINKKPIVFLFHPNEVINEKCEYKNIDYIGGNYFQHLLQDIIRSKLKEKNLGKNALCLFEQQIDFFLKRDYKFMSLKDYNNKFI